MALLAGTPSLRLVRWFLSFTASALLAAGCSGSGTEQVDAAVDTSAAVGADAAVVTSPASDEVVETTTDGVVETTTTARPTTTRAPAQLVEAVDFDVADYEGEPIVLWFWAPG